MLPYHTVFQGSLTVKSAAFDSKLGGRDIDWAIAQHCADEFQAKTGKVCLVFLGFILAR